MSDPYLGRTPRAMHDKLRVWERGSDMVLAEHLTPAGRLATATLETVRFERPHRVSLRLVRGPVPYAAETYELEEVPEGTAFVYSGELGTDLWRVGQWWADRVAVPWESTVAHSLDTIQTEAERRVRRKLVLADAARERPVAQETISRFPERRHTGDSARKSAGRVSVATRCHTACSSASTRVPIGRQA